MKPFHSVGVVVVLVAVSTVAFAQRAHRLAPAGCSPDEYLVPGAPLQIEKGDLDGDGSVDLVTAEEYSDMVTVLRNRLLSHCSFSRRWYSLEEDGDVNRVTIADLDGDGSPDLVPLDWIWPSGPSRVGVLRNQGNGTFGAPTLYPVNVGVYGVTTADLDVDGDLDVVTSPSAGGGLISVFANLGEGTLAEPVHHPVGVPVGDLHTSADLDEDGDIDLVTGTSSHVRVFWNPGNGAFQTSVGYTVSSQSYAVEQADLDGDGDIDLATSGVSVLRNLGNGGFSVVNYSPDATYRLDLSIADLDGDRDQDLVVSIGEPFDFGLAVFPNRGDGTFAPRHVVTPGRMRALATADLDQDGDVDVAGDREGFPGSVRLFWNRGDGTFP